MKSIVIPKGSWMRVRAKGRYLYAQNGPVIIWSDKVQNLPLNAPVYCVFWRPGQNTLTANRIINSSELRQETA